MTCMSGESLLLWFFPFYSRLKLLHASPSPMTP